MSAPLGSHRQIAAEVRGLALNKVRAILKMKEAEMTRVQKDFHDTILLKLAPTLLPRLNEHTGEDGKDLFPIPILNDMNAFPTDNSNKENSAPHTPD